MLEERTHVVWIGYVWFKFCVAMLIDTLKLRRWKLNLIKVLSDNIQGGKDCLVLTLMRSCVWLESMQSKSSVVECKVLFVLWFGERGAQVGRVSKFMGQQLEEISGKRRCQSIHSFFAFKFIHQNMSDYLGWRNLKLKHATERIFQVTRSSLDFLCLVLRTT